MCPYSVEYYNLNHTTIFLPLLGVGCPPEGIANIMHEALTNFVKNNVVKNLQEVRIIVFQSAIIKTFIGATKDAIEGPGEYNN